MKKVEFVYREMLFQAIEKNNRRFTQSEISKQLGISLSTVNLALKPLRKMGAVEVKPRCLILVDPKKALYYWASIRNLEKDIIYSTRVEMPVREIEKEMPDDIVFGAYTAFKLRFKDVPADYSEVYIYGEVKERFPVSKKQPNLFALEKDRLMESYGKTTTLAQLFTDLWNIKEWYAKDFLDALEERINGILE